MCCLASTESAFEPGTEVVFGFSGVVFSSNSSKWSNSRATLAVSNLSESWSTSEAEEVEEIFAIRTPLSCTRFFFSTSLDRLLSSFLGSQSSFGCIFMVFFYIFLLSKGDSWNPIDMELISIWRWLSEDEVFATNSFTL